MDSAKEVGREEESSEAPAYLTSQPEQRGDRERGRRREHSTGVSCGRRGESEELMPERGAEAAAGAGPHH
jgi:hypothetical protein